MKKASLLVALVFTAGIVMGHGGSHQSLPEPGHTPGSLMYGLEQAYESVSLTLTFDKEEKVRKKVSFAQERLSESAHLAQENRTELAAQASTQYLETITEAEHMANQTGNENLTETVQKKSEENSEILRDLQQRLPEEASQGIQTALENMNKSQRGNVPDQPQNNSNSGQPEREMSGFVATGRAVN
jgi:hypothetical protein